MPANLEFAEYIWRLVVEACGGRCCVCHSDDGRKLVRGHLKRDTDGGAADFHNLIPICKSCNGKYKDGPTLDGRPEGWFERFLTLARTGQPARRNSEQVNLLAGCQPNENTEHKNVPDAEDESKRYYKTFTPTPAELAVKIVQEIIDESADWGDGITPPPKPPISLKRIAELQQHARDTSAADFRLAAEQFKKETPWLTGDPRRPYASTDSWLPISVNYRSYLKRGQDRVARVTEQLRLSRERERESAERDRVHRLESRWAEYLRVADVPIRVAIGGDDRDFIVAIAAERSANAPVREVTDEELQRCRDVAARHRAYEQDNVDRTRRKLMAKLGEVNLGVQELPEGEEKEVWDKRVAELRDELNTANNVRSLDRCENDIEQIEQLVCFSESGEPEF